MAQLAFQVGNTYLLSRRNDLQKLSPAWTAESRKIAPSTMAIVGKCWWYDGHYILLMPDVTSDDKTPSGVSTDTPALDEESKADKAVWLKNKSKLARRIRSEHHKETLVHYHAAYKDYEQELQCRQLENRHTHDRNRQDADRYHDIEGATLFLTTWMPSLWKLLVTKFIILHTPMSSL